MRLINYSLTVNDDGTYKLVYNYENNDGNTICVDAPRVDIDCVLEPLSGKEDIIFPNIKGHTILGEGFSLVK